MYISNWATTVRPTVKLFVCLPLSSMEVCALHTNLFVTSNHKLRSWWMIHAFQTSLHVHICIYGRGNHRAWAYRHNKSSGDHLGSAQEWKAHGECTHTILCGGDHTYRSVHRSNNSVIGKGGTLVGVWFKRVVMSGQKVSFSTTGCYKAHVYNNGFTYTCNGWVQSYTCNMYMYMYFLFVWVATLYMYIHVPLTQLVCYAHVFPSVTVKWLLHTPTTPHSRIYS